MAPLPHEIDASNSFLSSFFVPTRLPRRLRTRNETNEFKRVQFSSLLSSASFRTFRVKRNKDLPSPRFEPPTSESTGEYWPTGPRCPAWPSVYLSALNWILHNIKFVYDKNPTSLSGNCMIWIWIISEYGQYFWLSRSNIHNFKFTSGKVLV